MSVEPRLQFLFSLASWFKRQQLAPSILDLSDQLRGGA